MLFLLPGGLITRSHNYSTCQHNRPGEIGGLCQQQTWETAGETERLEERGINHMHFVILPLHIFVTLCCSVCLSVCLSLSISFLSH